MCEKAFRPGAERFLYSLVRDRITWGFIYGGMDWDETAAVLKLQALTLPDKSSFRIKEVII